MTQHIEAVFEHGVLRPLSPLTLPEHAVVHLSVSEPDSLLDERGTNEGRVSVTEFESILDQLSTTGELVPGTFSRVDIYGDHD